MISHRRPRARVSLATLTLGGLGLLCVGCGSEPEPQAVAPPPRRAPAPPPPPALKSVETLMAELRIDERVILPEDQAPPTNEERTALLEFFDAFARGDAEALGPMLTTLDRLELETMVEEGAWSEATKDISSIEIQTGVNNLGQNCVLAVLEVNWEFEPQLWYYTMESVGPVFEAALTPPNILNELSGDWIAAWHRILEEEIELALMPDEDLTPISENLDEEGPSSSGSSGGGRGPASSPNSTPPPGRGRRKPPSAPRRPPGPG